MFMEAQNAPVRFSLWHKAEALAGAASRLRRISADSSTRDSRQIGEIIPPWIGEPTRASEKNIGYQIAAY